MITEVPAETPVTNPVAAFTVATPGVALDHVPPAVVPVHVAVPPTLHKGVVPVMVCAIGAVMVTVLVEVALAQGALPVAVKVKVTLPAVISAALGV